MEVSRITVFQTSQAIIFSTPRQMEAPAFSPRISRSLAILTAQIHFSLLETSHSSNLSWVRVSARTKIMVTNRPTCLPHRRATTASITGSKAKAILA